MDLLRSIAHLHVELHYICNVRVYLSNEYSRDAVSDDATSGCADLAVHHVPENDTVHQRVRTVRTCQIAQSFAVGMTPAVSSGRGYVI